MIFFFFLKKRTIWLLIAKKTSDFCLRDAFKRNLWRWMLSAGTVEKQRVDDDIKKKKRLEGSHYKICVQESSIKGWRGATRTDTSNWLGYLREVTELDAEGVWQGCFHRWDKNHTLQWGRKTVCLIWNVGSWYSFLTAFSQHIILEVTFKLAHFTRTP